MSSRSSTLRFAATFLGLIAVFATLTSLPAADPWLHEPLSLWIATLSGWLLWPFGVVEQRSHMLAFDGFWVQVVEACDGVQPTYIYVAAILAFPSPLRARLLGVLIGIPTIFAINVIRVASLVVLGSVWPEIFEQVHIYVWQTLVILLAMALWVYWAEAIAQPAIDLSSPTSRTSAAANPPESH